MGQIIDDKYTAFGRNGRPSTPAISLIIVVFNDWVPLSGCLQSIARQSSAPSVEVIIVDDGSREPVPQSVLQWSGLYPIVVIRQAHLGIPTARNRGIRSANGSMLLFVDADCKLEEGCLAALHKAAIDYSQRNYFQLRLIGGGLALVGRAEELRLGALQKHLLQPDGSIRYLNTAGFAIRRKKVNIEKGLFDPRALRAEDTLLLGNLIQDGELPWFVPDAVVAHAIPLTVLGCLRKDVRTAYQEGRVYKLLATNGFKIRLSHSERLQMLCSMWRASRQRSIGRAAWFVLAARQALQRLITVIYQIVNSRSLNEAW